MRTDRDDGRHRVIRLSELGRSIMKRVMMERRDMMDEIFSVLSEEDKEALIEVLFKIDFVAPAVGSMCRELDTIEQKIRLAQNQKREKKLTNEISI